MIMTVGYTYEFEKTESDTHHCANCYLSNIYAVEWWMKEPFYISNDNNK